MKNSERPVVVYYFKRGNIVPVKTSYQMDLNRATANCFHHMMIDHYDADIAQVCYNPTNEVYAEFVWRKNGELKPTFKKDPAKHETRYSVAALI